MSQPEGHIQPGIIAEVVAYQPVTAEMLNAFHRQGTGFAEKARTRALEILGVFPNK